MPVAGCPGSVLGFAFGTGAEILAGFASRGWAGGAEASSSEAEAFCRITLSRWTIAVPI